MLRCCCQVGTSFRSNNPPHKIIHQANERRHAWHVGKYAKSVYACVWWRWCCCCCCCWWWRWPTNQQQQHLKWSTLFFWFLHSSNWENRNFVAPFPSQIILRPTCSCSRLYARRFHSIFLHMYTKTHTHPHAEIIGHRHTIINYAVSSLLAVYWSVSVFWIWEVCMWPTDRRRDCRKVRWVVPSSFPLSKR